MPPKPRNVINTADVDAFMADVASANDVDALPGLADWLIGTAKRWVLRDYERYWRIERDSLTDHLIMIDPADPGERVVGPYNHPAPDWIVKALARGDLIALVRLNATLHKIFDRIIRWARETTAPDEKPVLTRMSVPDAIDQARAWFRATRSQPDEPPGTSLLHSHGKEYHFFRLETPEALEIEGERMANCVGSYASDVQNGECEIISMRRAVDGASRATVEIDSDGYIQQAKGHANGPVREQDRLALRQFVDTYGYRVAWDHESFDVPQNIDIHAVDGEALFRLIQSPEGQQWLHDIRYAGTEDLTGTALGRFLQQVITAQAHITPETRRLLFRTLAPVDRPIVLRPAYTAPVYDEEISVIRVLGPTPLFQLAQRQFFEADQLRIAAAMQERAAAILPALALREADRVFDLGHWRAAQHGVHFDGLAGGPANLLNESPIDITVPRRHRLNALRRRMNAAKYRTIGRTAAPSEPHLAMRRLLDGDEDRYVI